MHEKAQAIVEGIAVGVTSIGQHERIANLVVGQNHRPCVIARCRGIAAAAQVQAGVVGAEGDQAALQVVVEVLRWLAPASSAPLASRTVPRMDPRKLCAPAKAHANKTAHCTNVERVREIPLRENKDRVAMTGPPQDEKR